MHQERVFEPDCLLKSHSNNKVCFPIAFISLLTQAADLQQVLDIAAEWVDTIIPCDRVSVAIPENTHQLKVFAFHGNKAIPLDMLIPIENSFVGRVFQTQKLTICDHVQQSLEIDCTLLSSHGLSCCMDAPLINNGICYGTLNIAHKEGAFYNEQHAALLQSIASWLALNIALHTQAQRMEQLASIDDLTRVPNRRKFMNTIENKFKNYKATGKGFYVAILDLDNFKLLNDNHGHDAGDLMLVKSADVAKFVIGKQDFLARIGGEEFAFIIERDSWAEVVEAMEAVRYSIASLKVEHNNQPIGITTSIGVTHVRPQDATFGETIVRADQALYVAKERGRNCVELL
ncbi:sensor domain-containing diguanylate cyclase [Vibrio pelagius]|uniref:diguanylate cyclase n=1 Tax=Vibrio pelagius TaxID=28169 RepID=A0ABY5G4G3_VIBPE|nr:sensor domain-containing diguanylate cyclase [Vibrio pelagius]UTT85038.1 sensor domain-containing diguanylate cyclase [Vibrio pelagius]